ncbi:adenylate/guanylate cyclase domain-containing protein [uncultured Roseibium sp.]|uniref:CHASE2 domain-containing protein n=1 Tax=uncultured Roseibium sp. TaxID=1936171 RepID=UPI0026384781|nr:adenylate/guanylate cyclase domain-containing protein [uncultured Roseibium sp.]
MRRLIGKLNSVFGGARLSALLLLLFLLAVRVIDPYVVELIRLKTFDYYQVLKPRDFQKLPVAIVDIDEKSLAELGQWPWARSTLATILQNIAQAGGVAVAFDIVFPEPDRLSPDQYSKSVGGLSEALRQELAALPSTDRIMSDTMRRMRVVVGQAGGVDFVETDRNEQVQTPVALLGPDPKKYMFEYPQLLRNIELLEDAAAGKGLFSIYPDPDGIVRRAALTVIADGKIQPALSVELLRVATGQDAFAVKSDEAGISSVVVGGAEVPTDRNGRIWVHYTPSNPLRFVSASDIANGTFDPARIRDHLVLVGPSATGLLDLKATPLNPTMPGVEVHAQILENILSGSFLKRPNYALGAELVAAAVLSLLTIILVPILGALPVMAFGFVLAASWVGGSWYLFSSEKLLLDAIYPLFTSLSVFFLLVFINYRREEIQRQEIRSAFAQYLAPDYVEQIAKNPENLALGGERRKMTILFSDVRNFTNISESFADNPQGLTALMNRFLTPLSNGIMEKRGTIDKYMGDAIMAFWNAPLDDDSQEIHACEAALLMVRRMRAINVERKQEADTEGHTFFPLNVGVGINTGDCVVGNMGSEFRFDYSVLGDSVNLAARLEGQTKTYGVTILIGNNTAHKVMDLFALVEADLIRVKGKKEPERIYCLLGDMDLALKNSFAIQKASFEKMLQNYRAQNWDTALSHCDDVQKDRENELSRLAETFRLRIEAFKKTPPPAEWDGVFVAETK